MTAENYTIDTDFSSKGTLGPDVIQKVERVLEAARSNPKCVGVDITASSGDAVAGTARVVNQHSGTVREDGLWTIFH